VTPEEEARLVERQQCHADKMEAVGRLAGGVAHELNNVLSVILSYGELLLVELRSSDPMREDIEEICKAGRRAAALTKQLLTLSRQELLDARTVDLHEVLADVKAMLERVAGEDVVVLLETARSLAPITADRGHIEQLLANLTVNAREAMPHGGHITISIADVELDELFARTHLGVRPGPHVLLTVRDTGVGMDGATVARIFEPFFTTKEKGRASGLGLSTVFGIVQQSGGTIWVESEIGTGTSFKIYFPRRAPSGTAASSADAEAEPEAAALPGSETILLVEDEEQVRKVARSILQRQGYVVLEASSAAEALGIGKAHAGVIHLLLTDVLMPEMTGPELVEAFAALRPATRVICMSGFTDGTFGQQGLISSGIPFLQKPITQATLARKVREVLDS
jgi:two-component system, cell cycle sensor histidine kinase and response regulator CckA